MEAAEVFFGESTHVYKPKKKIGSGLRAHGSGLRQDLGVLCSKICA